MTESPLNRGIGSDAASFGRAEAPDFPEEILGWKVLAVSENGRLSHHLDQMHDIVIPTALASPLEHTHWPSHDWLRASCRRDPEHTPPVEECTCGVYAVEDAGQAASYLREAPLTVLARVGLAGKIIPGTRGWRAERARIVALTQTGIGLSTYPRLFRRVAKRYDVPILDLDLSNPPAASR